MSPLLAFPQPLLMQVTCEVSDWFGRRDKSSQVTNVPVKSKGFYLRLKHFLKSLNNCKFLFYH